MHVEQLQSPADTVGTFAPAAAQLKPPVGAFGIWKVGKVGALGIEGVDLELGAGLSQATHLVALSELAIMQVPQLHDPVLEVGCFIPAAAQSKPAFFGGSATAGLDKGFGVSQATHLSTLSEFEIMQVLQVQEPGFVAEGLRPAAAQSNPPLVLGCSEMGSGALGGASNVVVVVFVVA